MSSSSATNTVQGSSRTTPKPTRGVAPPPAIFPNVITSPGSPPGLQPSVPNTIVQAFSKQRLAKDKTEVKATAHADIRQRIVQFLAAPASHNDPLRTLSVDQLNELDDVQLMRQAFLVLTIDNVGGQLRLADGSMVSMRQCIDLFALTAKTRDGATIKRLLKEKLNELQAIAEVERYKTCNDDIDDFCDDDLSGAHILDFGDDFPHTTKRTLFTTMAGATVGKKQRRSPCKRPHNPTNRLGVNVALKDHQVLYATENRSLKDNRRLLMVPGFHSSKGVGADAPTLPCFRRMCRWDQNLHHLTMLYYHSLSILCPLSHRRLLMLRSRQWVVIFISTVQKLHLRCLQLLLPPVVVMVEMETVMMITVHHYPKASDYGTEDHHSESSSVHSDYDNSKASDDPLFDTFANSLYQNGHLSDLFEKLFQTLPVDAASIALPEQH